MTTNPDPSSSVLESRGLNPVRAVFDNGAVFLGKRTPTTPAVTIHLAVRAGSFADPTGAPGTTWLLSRVMVTSSRG